MGRPARKPVALPAEGNDAANDARMLRKPALRFFTCGSVDDGKSTLIGRLLYEAGAVLDDQMDTLASDSRRFGTTGSGLDFALLVDGLAAEREQGITIDVAYRYFATPRRAFIVADTPGHEQYTRNMATGASTADLAVILVDARLGLLPQTRRHSTIVSMVGVKSVVLAVNKMDLVGYDEAVFRRIVDEYVQVAGALGLGQVVPIPISARDGDNITAASAAMPWYRGPLLLPYLEEVEPAREAAQPGAILPVQWVNRPDADFRGYSGTLARGRLTLGDSVAAVPSGRTGIVTRIIGPAGDLRHAEAGQPVTVSLAEAIDVSRGDVLVENGRRPLLRTRLHAKLLWTGDAPLQASGDYHFKLASTTARAVVEDIRHAIDIHSLQPVAASDLAANDIGVVTLALDRPVLALPFSQSAELGGFILIDRVTHETVALGFVSGLEDAVGPEAGAAPAPVSGENRLREAVLRWLGPRGSLGRSLRAGQVLAHLLCGFLLALAVYGLSGRAWLAVAIGAADLLLRPPVIFLVKAAAARLWHGRRARAMAASENAEGGGI